MNTTVLLLPFALSFLVLWFTYRAARRNTVPVVSGPIQQRVAQQLLDRFARGEISADDYTRLTALMR